MDYQQFEKVFDLWLSQNIKWRLWDIGLSEVADEWVKTQEDLEKFKSWMKWFMRAIDYDKYRLFSRLTKNQVK